MGHPATPEGKQVYRTLYALENYAKSRKPSWCDRFIGIFVYSKYDPLPRLLRDHHTALDHLRVSLNRELPTPDEITILGGPGGNKDGDD